jgi:hypothetical protein
MTTIVANLECMAADQRMTSEGPIGRVQKLHRIGDCIYGIAGDVMMGLAVLEWMKSPKRDRTKLYKMIDEVEPRSHISILELSPAGLAIWDGWGMRLALRDTFFGVGTGAPSAMQAIKRGLSPEDAVRETFSLDECSGGEVEVEWLLPPELKRKR